MLFSVCACSVDEPTVTATPAPTPTPTPELAGVVTWKELATKLYNMEYAGLAEYWSLMCSDYFGDNINSILSVLSFPEKEYEIAQKRLQYNEKYGEDWKYEIIECEKTALDEKACNDFAEELEDISDKASVLVNAADEWSKQEWDDFAGSLDCTAEQAKEVVAAYESIASACHEAYVAEGFELTLTLSFTGSKTDTLTRTETDCIYNVNGVFVSEMLLDCTYALINLVY